MANTFGSQGVLKIDNQDYTIHRLEAVVKKYPQEEEKGVRLGFFLTS
jgi:hypothetical protein